MYQWGWAEARYRPNSLSSSRIYFWKWGMIIPRCFWFTEPPNLPEKTAVDIGIPPKRMVNKPLLGLKLSKSKM